MSINDCLSQEPPIGFYMLISNKNTNGYSEFTGWIKRTIECRDSDILLRSIANLEQEIARYDCLFEIGYYFSRDALIHSRLREGFEKLKQSIESN